MDKKFRHLLGSVKLTMDAISTKGKLYAVFIALLIGIAVNAQANIFDDIIDAITDLFSSAKNVVESVIDDVDTTIVANITGRCSVVEAEDSSGDAETQKPVDNCGFDVRELKEVFEEAGGEIADIANEVENGLSQIPMDEWDDVAAPFADVSKELILFFGDALFDPIMNVANDIVDMMSEPANTLNSITFPSEGLDSGTTLDISYVINLKAASLELFVRGAVASTIQQTGIDFVGVNGMLNARLRTNATTGWTPMAMADLSYVNPIIRVEDGRITGIMVMQPNGAIYLSVTGLPFQFSADLSQLMQIPALNNIPLAKRITDAISADIDIGSVTLSTPLTNQDNARFPLDVTISGGVDVVAAISSGWRVRIMERVSWTKGFTLDIPPLNLPLESLPPGVIGELDPDTESEPSYARQIVAYDFDESAGSTVIEDKSGFGNHARVYGNVNLNNGAAYFGGTDGYIDLPDDLMKDTDAITVYAEVFINEEQASPYFIYGLGNTADNGWGDGYLFATGNFYRSAVSTCHWICEQSILEEGVNLPRGSWQKIAYTLQGNEATLYLNGDVFSQKTDMTVKPSDIGGGRTTANYLGRSVYAGDHYFNGAIRTFQIWDGALTHAEIVEKFVNTPTTE